MRNLFSVVLLLAAGQTSLAQRPSNTSICDYYAAQRYGENTTSSQLRLIQSIVTFAYAGGSGLAGAPSGSTGIFNQGTFEGLSVYLRPWFDGSKATTNLNNQPVGINWLDGGSTGPLVAFLNGSTDSVYMSNTTNQYRLFTHWFTAFGFMYGCTLASKFPRTSDTGGPINIAYVHKFMNLNQTELGYFIDQLRVASKFYGFSDTDASTLNTFMNARYNVRCAPAVNGQLYSLCQADECPLAQPNADCNAYVNLGPGGASNTTTATQTVTAAGSTPTGSPTGSSATSASASATATTTPAAQASESLSTGAIAGIAIGGAAVLLLAVGLWLYFRRQRTKQPQLVPVPMPTGGYASPASPPPMSQPSYSPHPHSSVAYTGTPHESYMGGLGAAPGYWNSKPGELGDGGIDPTYRATSPQEVGHVVHIAEMESPQAVPPRT